MRVADLIYLIATTPTFVHIFNFYYKKRVNLVDKWLLDCIYDEKEIEVWKSRW